MVVFVLIASDFQLFGENRGGLGVYAPLPSY